MSTEVKTISRKTFVWSHVGAITVHAFMACLILWIGVVALKTNSTSHTQKIVLVVIGGLLLLFSTLALWPILVRRQYAISGNVKSSRSVSDESASSSHIMNGGEIIRTASVLPSKSLAGASGASGYVFAQKSSSVISRLDVSDPLASPVDINITSGVAPIAYNYTTDELVVKETTGSAFLYVYSDASTMTGTPSAARAWECTRDRQAMTIIDDFIIDLLFVFIFL